MTARLTPIPTTWTPGMLIPGTVYRVIRPIGHGGMGEVYEVEHDLLGTRRALKVLVKHYAGRKDLAGRLRVEARGLARLKHPNLVEVYDLGTAADGRIFFAMELLDGVTLRAMLKDRGRLSLRTSVELVIQVLAGLQAAHEAGILHRDVKPENVFVCQDGNVKLLDFGVAKTIDAWLPSQRLTVQGMTVGTPQYMSPEQAEGGRVDVRTDVYATGQVLWEMLAGRPAFSQTDLYEITKAKWESGVPSLASFPGVEASPALCNAVDRACQPDAKNRFATADDFRQALREAMDEQLALETHASDAVSQGASPAHAGDPSSPVGYELTQRVQAVRSVNRHARTETDMAGPRMVGPTGTEVLPAVAARMSPRPAAQSNPPEPILATPRPTNPPESKTSTGFSLFGLPLISWIAGASAFFLPVLIASTIAYWHVKNRSERQPQLDPEPMQSAISIPPASSISPKIAEIAEKPPESAKVVASAPPANSSSEPVELMTRPLPALAPKPPPIPIPPPPPAWGR